MGNTDIGNIFMVAGEGGGGGINQKFEIKRYYYIKQNI